MRTRGTPEALGRRSRPGLFRPVLPVSSILPVLPILILSCVPLAWLSGCGDGAGDGPVELRFWAMGREGEMVVELVRDFQAENPDIRVRVQQIPWSAAHEKLVTAHVGRASPDIAQLGNTWIAEFAALRALEPLDERLDAAEAAAFFPGILATNEIDDVLYGIPWYVDTRVLFYRSDLLSAAGYDSMPGDWDGWKEAMRAVKALSARDGGAQNVAAQERFAIFLPINEWNPPVILGMQAGSPLLSPGGTRGVFSGPEFERAFDFYLDLFREGLAPPVANNEIANLYQEFARGTFAMYITGPWNLGEFRNRLPEELQDDWATAPLPGPRGPESGISLAGGSSLVLFRSSEHKDAAWKLVEFLSRPEQQLRFWRLTGDLPARLEAWTDSALIGDPRTAAFREQLLRVEPTPKIPEWERIASRVQERTELAVRRDVPADSVLRLLDADVEQMLEKRRWLMEKRETAETAR